MTIRRMLFHYG